MIVPYARINETWSLPDDYLESVFDRIVSDGTLNKVFWDGSIRNKSQFLNYLKDPKNLPIFIYSNDELQGLCWISGVCRNYAFVHYCSFSNTWGEDKTDSIESAISYWFGFRDNDKPLFDILIGMTPTNNRHAIRFLDKCGFRQVGEIPDMADDVYEGKKFPIMISYRRRHG